MGHADAVLNPDQIWALVKRFGGYGAVARYLESTAVTNPKTRKQWSRSTIARQARKSRGYRAQATQQERRAELARRNLDRALE